MAAAKKRGEAGEAGGGEYNRAEHPSHAVAAQPHFATSILPARLHSHSVDPFTEGMSHMPPSFSPLSSSPLGRIPSSPSNPRTLWLSLFRAIPRGSCLRQSGSLSILSRRPSLSSVQARQRLPSPFPPLFLSFSLASRAFYQSVPLSLRLCCATRGGSGLAGKWKRRLHLLPHLGISRVAHLPYIERSEGGRGERDEERETERNLGAR